MHLFYGLFFIFIKNLGLEVRNELVRENATFRKEKMVRRENHEKRKARERNHERKKWYKFMIFLRIFLTFSTFMSHMYVIRYRFVI